MTKQELAAGRTKVILEDEEKNIVPMTAAETLKALREAALPATSARPPGHTLQQDLPEDLPEDLYEALATKHGGPIVMRSPQTG